MKNAISFVKIASFAICLLLITACSPTIDSNQKDPSQTDNTGTQENTTETNEEAGETETSKTGTDTIQKFEANPEIALPGDFTMPAQSEIKLIDNIKIFKVDLGAIKNLGPLGGKSTTEEKSVFALDETNLDIEGLSVLGHGYDIFTNYAWRQYVKPYEILNFNKLLKDGKIFKENVKNSIHKMVSSENARSYSKEVANTIGVSGNYLFFGGSTKMSFSSTHIENASSYFSTIFYNITRYKLYIDPLVDLKAYINEDAQNYLENNDAKTIFKNVGTHVLTAALFGGRLDYSVSIDKSYVKDVDSFSQMTKAKFNAGFASAGMSYESSTTTTTEEFNTNISESIMTYGGNGVDGKTMAYDPNVLKDWMLSVDAEPDLSDFVENAMIPIWEFCKTSACRGKLEAAYPEYANENMTIIPSEMTVSALRLVFLTLSQAPVDKIPDDQGNWYLIGNIAARTDLPTDELAYLYARYNREDDPNHPPIVEIFFENESQGEDARAYFDQKYGGDPDAQLYGWNGTTNIEGSELGRTINTYGAELAGAHKIRLYYVTSPNREGIRELYVRHIANNNQTYYSKPITEPDKIEIILDLTSVAQSKPIAQDIAEGSGQYAKAGMISFIVYRNLYLEFIR